MLAKEFDDQQQDKSEGNTTLMIKRQDVGTMEQNLSPKNDIKLVEVGTLMEDILLKACGGLMDKVEAIQEQVKRPLDLYSANEETKETPGKVSADEVAFCQAMAKDHLTIFRSPAAFVEICLSVANAFERILEENADISANNS